MGKVNNTGRSNHEGGYVKLPYYIMDSFSWGQLSVTAQCAWMQFVRVYNGSNNGRLAMLVRNLALKLNISRASAARALDELLTFGFVEITKGSSFSQSGRRENID